MAIEKISPATPAKPAARKRIPMSVPQQKLEVADLPGYHLHWFRGTSERIARAIDGGYEYVLKGEVEVNATGLGTPEAAGGNTDMGSHVSIVSGDEIGKDGQPVRMILMKIRQELFEEDQALLEARNEQIAEGLRGGTLGAEKDGRGDTQQRYVDQRRTKLPDLFTPKRPKVAI